MTTAVHVPDIYDKAYERDMEAWRAIPLGGFEITTQPNGQREFWMKCLGKCGQVTPLLIRPVVSPSDRHSWELTGTPEHPTLHPSIHHPGCWHGWLTDGVYRLA